MCRNTDADGILIVMTERALSPTAALFVRFFPVMGDLMTRCGCWEITLSGRSIQQNQFSAPLLQTPVPAKHHFLLHLSPTERDVSQLRYFIPTPRMTPALFWEIREVEDGRNTWGSWVTFGRLQTCRTWNTETDCCLCLPHKSSFRSWGNAVVLVVFHIWLRNHR